MKFRHLLSMALLAVTAFNASAQIEDGGTYYLKNVESGLFFGGENNWGTKGTLSDKGDLFKLIKLSDGVYTIQNTVVSVNDKNLGANFFVDNAGATGGWTIAEVESGIYTIYNAEPGYMAQGTEALAKGFAAVGVKEVTNAAKWYILTKEQAVAQMATATAENPVPASFLISNPGFNRNYSNTAWTIEASNKNLCGGTNDNKCAESYRSTFTLSQTIEGAPKGMYTLTAQGFYRQDGTDNENLPVFYANGKTATFPLKTGSENSMDAASNSFAKGLYTIDPITFEVGDDGVITLGAKLETNVLLWCIWDNFVLTYYGATATAEDVQNAEAIKAYKAALAAAKAVDTDKTMDATALKGITDAIANYAEDKVLTNGATTESINAATAALNAAAETATKSISNAEALMAMNDLMESTNVYTKDAYDAYKKLYDDYTAAWTAGTLTETVVNPSKTTGWHAENDCDNFLLSAWDTNPDFKDNPAYYINTWSVEGDNDGTNFKVPFFEYWTGDANSLGAKTLTATMTDLPTGSYSVSAWVRVRTKNETGADIEAYGITLQANEGEAVDVTKGETKIALDKTNNFFLEEAIAYGDVTDGTLKIKFNVAADNNISWLSFKNVKFERLGPPTAISEVANKATAKTIFNVAGQQMSGLQKGINIVDGKKVYLK